MVWFIPYLAMIFSVELINNILFYSYGIANSWVYNIFHLLQICFFCFVFINLAQTKKHKQFLLFTNFIYVLIYCTYLTVYAHWLKVKPDLMVAGFIEMVTFSCLFFYQCLRDDYDVWNQKYKTGLWITAGILIFYSGISICYSLIPYISKYDLKLQGKRLYNIIPQYLCIILYGCLSISFILWKKPAKTSLEQ